MKDKDGGKNRQRSIRLSGVRRIIISSQFIRLDALLKFASIASTGGEAKMLIQNGDVFVDGEPCTQRGKKIISGGIVRIGETTLVVKQRSD